MWYFYVCFDADIFQKYFFNIRYSFLFSYVLILLLTVVDLNLKNTYRLTHMHMTISHFPIATLIWFIIQNNLTYEFSLSWTQWQTCWVDPTKSFSSSSTLLCHQYDWRHTIWKPSLRSCDGHWSMPSILVQQARGTPGSSIWSPGFSRTHSACSAAGLAGWTSVCDVQADWMSRPATRVTSQMNVLCTRMSFRNMWVNVSVISIWLLFPGYNFFSKAAVVVYSSFSSSFF